MRHALAVVSSTEASKQVVREAGELAAGVGAELTLLHVTTEEKYTETYRQLESISDYDTEYSVYQAEQGAANFAEDIGREVLDGVEIEYEAAGALGDLVDTVLDYADRNECDHVFVGGRTRSPTGKALFGDDTQQIILDFDGPVTVLTA
ncbi:MAG: universal stress protein [Haloferacaceae archaeon]